MEGVRNEEKRARDADVGINPGINTSKRRENKGIKGERVMDGRSNLYLLVVIS